MLYQKPAGGALAQIEVPIPNGTYYRATGQHVYSLTDHLGNVRAVVARRTAPAVGLTVASVADYYPFGWEAPGRGTGSYRYGYQGNEKDPETGWWAFQLRMYDGRVGRWMSVDPFSQFQSPYLAMGNNPIRRIDKNGGQSEPSVDAGLFDALLTWWGNLTVSVKQWIVKNVGLANMGVPEDFIDENGYLAQVHKMQEVKITAGVGVYASGYVTGGGTAYSGTAGAGGLAVLGSDGSFDAIPFWYTGGGGDMARDVKRNQALGPRASAGWETGLILFNDGNAQTNAQNYADGPSVNYSLTIPAVPPVLPTGFTVTLGRSLDKNGNEGTSWNSLGTGPNYSSTLGFLRHELYYFNPGSKR